MKSKPKAEPAGYHPRALPLTMIIAIVGGMVRLHCDHKAPKLDYPPEEFWTTTDYQPPISEQ